MHVFLEKRILHQPVIYSPLSNHKWLGSKAELLSHFFAINVVFFNKSKQETQEELGSFFQVRSPKKSWGLFFWDEILPSDVGIYNDPY